MSVLPVSVVILTKNEEQNIHDCLMTTRTFGEAFVVDSQSEDRTREIAGTLGAKVVTFNWNGRLPKKKQWSLDNLPFRYDWVLFLDADERVTPELEAEISDVLERRSDIDGWFVALDYVFLGRRLRHGARVWKLALFRRSVGRFADYDDLAVHNMWEVEGHFQPTLRSRTANLRARIVHHDHTSLFDYFARHNRYSDWEAWRIAAGKAVPDEDQPAARQSMKVVFWSLPARPLLFFAYAYVMRLGFLDGRPGFHYALAKAIYYWQTGLKVRELKSAL